jgi:two-component system, NtrC family, nitrogen regulation sensor histidine kinase NtrY
MPATLHRMPAPPRRGPAAPTPPRKPLKDNPRLIVAGIVLLLVALAGILVLAERSTRLSLDFNFLTEFVLYALSAADLTMLAALVFVLARNIIKLIVERRRALPFARFRAKLVMVLLCMTFVPAVLVLITGSELIRNSVERWFNAPMDEILNSANQIASDYYHERQTRVGDEAGRLARTLSGVDLSGGNVAALRALVAEDVKRQRVQMVQVYRIDGAGRPSPDVQPVVDIAASTLPPDYDRAIGDRLAARTAAGMPDSRVQETLSSGGELIRAAALIRRTQTTPAVGVVVASDYLTGDIATRSRSMTKAYEQYTQARVLKRPLTGVYLSFFLMVTLLILVSATWMGLYLAKRITRPVQLLAAAAKEIGAGHLDHRVEADTRDEFGSLIEAFNTMAGELAANRRTLERSTQDLERKHLEVEERRRYMETILERVATGVVSVDAAGQIGTVNAAAERLLGLDASAVRQPASVVFGAPDLQPLGALLRDAARGAGEAPPQEVAIVRDGRELHLAAIATVLHGEQGSAEGMVLVVDDVTPLIRAQKVAAWRDVARRLAHEIKNPLTPIQLCADRLRRHFTAAPPATRALVDECTQTIAGEVESLKALVDEFSQFARMPQPRTMPTDLHRLITETLALYNGLFHEVTLHRRFAPTVPPVRVDPEQIRRVLINLVDNALEAMDRKGDVFLETQHDATNGVARIIVADNGPGIPPGERDKLFLPYYSTKRRGSGLGLAIVRRIIAEHGGSIEVGENTPRGTRFTIELPC